MGVQCKNTVDSITEDLIKSECTKAESFHPPLSELYIATTADRDAKIQLFARTFSEERRKNGLFPVHVVFWPDIVSDLGRDDNVARQHYPQFFANAHLNPSQLARRNEVARIQSALSGINFSLMSSELRWGAKYIHSSIVDGFNWLRSAISSPTFNITDISFSNILDLLLSEWGKLLDLVGQAPYNDRGDTLIFHMPGDFIRDKDENALYEAINTQIDAFQHAIRLFCSFVNTKYPEVQLR